ncbi:4Fe-4S dicluster domain-containing protein [Candidatus Woesearchaeota archaeon]|nr:4Fe-4S dicluster domain-containing protein [Candidatus Woesearchaeota archaeon]
MAHMTSKSYYSLQKRLDKAAQGAPYSETLFKILKILFTEKEARLASKLPLNFFTIKQAAEIWKKSQKESAKILDGLADKGILLDVRKGKKAVYFLIPTMAGFFEFSLMRTDGKFDRKVLSELFYQYLNVEDDFTRKLFLQDPNLGRIFVQENTVLPKYKSEVLDYEKATKVIETASCITVGTCYCRHKMEHFGKACDMPQDVCLTFNKSAESLARHGIAKKISKKKAKQILDRCVKLGLVQFGDNVQDDVNFICNCCGCCCEALLAYKRFGWKADTGSNYLSKHSDKKCVGCGVCAQKCPVDAIEMIKSKKGKKYARVNPHRCIGCGVCVNFCPTKSRMMEKKSKRKFVPKDTFERILLEAIDSGKVQNYIFDNLNLFNHSILRRFIGTIMKLKPARKLLAIKQIRSRFMNAMMRSDHYKPFEKFFKEGKRNYDYSHPELKKAKK